jgi:hypothetical protein
MSSNLLSRLNESKHVRQDKQMKSRMIVKRILPSFVFELSENGKAMDFDVSIDGASIGHEQTP